MKRLLNILTPLVLALGAFPAQVHAQENNQELEQEQSLDQPTLVENVSYIYRNDDHFNGFADSEVDSITFSRFDLDSVEHIGFVTQVVYTRDSIYRIPLEAIDSVVCQQPQIELQDDVVRLTDEHLGFLVRADSTTLLFRSDTPRDLLPERGEVVLGMTTDTQKPFQFAGRVLKTQRTPEGVLVTCDPGLELGDIFRRLTAVMFTSPRVADDQDPEWTVPHTKNREQFDPFSPSFNWTPKTLTHVDENGKKTTYTDKYISGIKKDIGEVKKDLLEYIPKDKLPDGLSGEAKFEVSAKCNIAYRQKFVIDFFKDDDDWIIPSLYLYWRPTLLPTFTGNLHLHIDGKWEKELTFLPDLPAIGIWIPPTPVSPPIRIGEVNIHVTQFYFEIGAKTDITYEAELKKIFDVELEHNSSGIHVHDMTKKENGGYVDKSGITNKGFTFGNKSELGDNIDQIAKFWVWFAWKPTLGLSLINERVLTAKLELKVGPWVEFNLERRDDVADDDVARTYKRWAPTHLLTKLHLTTDFKVILAQGTSVEKNFSLAEKLQDWHIGDGKGWDFMEQRFGIFPGFGPPSLTKNWQQNFDHRGIVSFTTPYYNPDKGTPGYSKVTRTSLSAELGVGVYKDNGDGTQTEVATSLSPQTKKGWFNKSTGSYTTEFKDLKRGIYKAAPVFDAVCFKPLRATPEADIVIPPSVITEEATDVSKHHCFMKGYTLGLKAFSEQFGGEPQLGWIAKKVVEGGASGNLDLNNKDFIGTFSVGDAEEKTENGEDKLYFGQAYKKTRDKSRCDGLRPASIYQYRTYAIYPGLTKMEFIYGEVKEFTTQPPEEEPRCATDLGLSVDWACYNLGATFQYNYGNYYAWGEKETKSEYTAENYELPNKENISGNTDYDAATTWNVGKNSGWRMPTRAEFQELIDNCDMEWVTDHKVQGIKFTSRINKNSIFLPAAGNKYGKKVYSNGIGGCYWTADLDPESLTRKNDDNNDDIVVEVVEDDEGEKDVGIGEEGIGDGDARELTKEEKADSWRLHFNNVEEEGKAPHNEAGRCFYGRSIRPVRAKQQVSP